MGIRSGVNWCDSSVNAEMGCDGCELWTPKLKQCYAGTITEQYKGQKGWPDAFDKPKIFPGRIENACKWPDLTGTKRPDRPWLDDMPRVIFMNDMGDTFTKELPLDWIMPWVPMMKESKHIWLWLTKRPARMVEFQNLYLDGEWPDNFWPGITIMNQASANGRMPQFMKLNSRHKWLSIEPMLSAIDITPQLFDEENYIDGKWVSPVSWAVLGGESGDGFRPLDHHALGRFITDCNVANVPVFVKQDSNVRPGIFDTLPKELQVREMGRING